MKSLLALIIAVIVTLAACGSDATTAPDASDTTPQDGRLPQPNLTADGLALRITGTADGELLCPGDRRPCMPYTGTIDLDAGSAVWVAGRLHDGAFEVDNQQSLADASQRRYVNQCPDQEIVGSPPNDVLESLYEDETMRPAGFVDLWDSDDGVLHMGIFGDPDPAEAFLADLGIAQQVCLVIGFSHSDATLEAVQFALNDAAADYGFDNYSSSRNNWEGTVTFSLPEFDQGFREVIDELSAANSDVPIYVEASVEVVNGSIADYDELLNQIEVRPDAGQQLKAKCGPVTFSTAPPDLDEFPPLDTDAQSALDALVNGAAVVDGGMFGVDTRWSMAMRSDDVLVLFGQQQSETPTSFAQFVQRDGVWAPTGWGGCWTVVEAPGLGSATVSTNPGALPTPEDTDLALFITEQPSAGGRAPTDREVVVVVTETPDEVNIIALVAPVEGDATCPSNPPHPITVTLDAPLGDRTLVDGSRFPSQPISPSEDIEN